MEIKDGYYNTIVWIAEESLHEIIPGVDYWFSYQRGHMLNNGLHNFNISNKLANKILDTNVSNTYIFYPKYPNLREINVNGIIFLISFEKYWNFSGDPEQDSYVLKGTSSYLKVNGIYASKKERSKREKKHINIEFYNQFIKTLNSVI